MLIHLTTQIKYNLTVKEFEIISLHTQVFIEHKSYGLISHKYSFKMFLMKVQLISKTNTKKKIVLIGISILNKEHPTMN